MLCCCRLAKNHRDGHHWATAEAGAGAGARPHPSKTVNETPSEGLNAFKISTMHKKYTEYTQNICLNLSSFPDLLFFVLVALGAAAFVAVQQRIHSQVSPVCSCACGVHRVPCTSSSLRCAGFFLKCSHLSWDAWAEPPTH